MKTAKYSLLVLGLVAASVLPWRAGGASSVVVYSNDFQGTVGPEWSNRETEVTPVGARRFLGQFASNTVTLALSRLPPHTALTVSFDLFMIESVDGNSVTNWIGGVVGPDIWDLSIDDTSVLHTSFSNVTDVRQDQAYPGNYPGGDYPAKTGAVETNTLGYTSHNRQWGDTVYHLTYTVAHSAASASVRFTGEFRDVYAVPEGWGINNVVVSVTPAPAVVNVTCPPAAFAECGVTSRLTARVSNSAGDAMTVVWAANGTAVQTNLVPARLPNTPVDVLLSWPFPVGTNDVVITVTAGTSVASCSTTVTVVDTTPPTLVCPPSQTVEFQDENGAVANFVVTASDTCSPVSLAVAPASGSVFPIGVTPVQAAAVDAATNLSQCSFTVTVLGAWGVKSNILAELVVLRAGATNRVDGWEVDEAIEDLIDALGLDVPNAPTWVQQAHRREHCVRHHHPRGPLWLDETHVDRRNGAWVFASEQDAVHELVEIIRYQKSGLPQPVAQDLIARLVRCDRLLAVVSIEDAVKTGASKHRIANLLKQVAEGDEDAAANQPVQAIHDYWAAWAEAGRLR